MSISIKARPVVAILLRPDLRRVVISAEAMRRLKRVARVRVAGEEKITPESAAKLLRGATACITGWGSPQLSAAVLAGARSLRMVAHAAGSVKAFVSEAIWERGIRVSSAAAAIAVEVAHYTHALMILGAKNVWAVNRVVRDGGWGEARPLYHELMGATVGIVGAGQVGGRVLELLAQWPPKRVLLYDPFVSAAQAKKLGATKCSLERLLAHSDIISLHAPAIPQTRHLLNRARLARIKDGAFLINTARGALIDEAALARELERGRLYACLDVTDPEPPARDHPFRKLPNVFLTPHIAGPVAEGRARLGDLAVEEVLRYFAGRPLAHEVRKEQLAKLA